MNLTWKKQDGVHVAMRGNEAVTFVRFSETAKQYIDQRGRQCGPNIELAKEYAAKLWKQESKLGEARGAMG